MGREWIWPRKGMGSMAAVPVKSISLPGPDSPSWVDMDLRHIAGTCLSWPMAPVGVGQMVPYPKEASRC